MDSDQRWTKDRGMRGRLPTFAAVVIYGLISSFSSADVCRRLSTEPSHGENRGSIRPAKTRPKLDAKKSVFGASNASENANSRESTRRPNAKARKNRKNSSA